MDYLRDSYPRPWSPYDPPPRGQGPLDWRFVAGLAVGLLLVALGFGFGVIAAAARNVGASGAPVAAATATTVPTMTATVAVTATVTTTVATTPGATTTSVPGASGLISGAYLGGTQAAFTATYGTPTTPYNTPVYAVPQPDGTAASASLYGFVAGNDGLQRVNNLTFALNPNSTWTAAANYLAAQTLFPPDALFVKDVQDPTLGVIHVYRSASLGATLPASAFADTHGGPVWQPGTLSVSCDVPGLEQCSLLTGV